MAIPELKPKEVGDELTIVDCSKFRLMKACPVAFFETEHASKTRSDPVVTGFTYSV